MNSKRKFYCTRYNRFLTNEESKLLSDKLLLSAKCEYLEDVVDLQGYYLSSIFKYLRYRRLMFHARRKLKKSLGEEEI